MEKKYNKVKFNKKNKQMEDDIKKLKRSNEWKKAIIVILVYIICLISMPLVLFYCCLKYDRPQYNEEIELGDVAQSSLIHNFTAMALSLDNQNAEIYGNTFLLRIEKYFLEDSSGTLYINDKETFDSNGNEVEADFAYIIDDYIIFTKQSRLDNSLVYAIDRNGNQISIQDNGYQMHDFRIVNGIMYATGYNLAEYFDGNDQEKELIIRFDNNMINVEEYSY